MRSTSRALMVGLGLALMVASLEPLQKRLLGNILCAGSQAMDVIHLLCPVKDIFGLRCYSVCKIEAQCSLASLVASGLCWCELHAMQECSQSKTCSAVSSMHEARRTADPQPSQGARTG